jgi:hypothetical protein
MMTGPHRDAEVIVQTYLGEEIVASCRWPRHDDIERMIAAVADAMCGIPDAKSWGDPAKFGECLFYVAAATPVEFGLEDCESEWEDPPYVVICRIGLVEGRAIYCPQAMTVVDPQQEPESTALPLAFLRAAYAYFIG